MASGDTRPRNKYDPITVEDAALVIRDAGRAYIILLVVAFNQALLFTFWWLVFLDYPVGIEFAIAICLVFSSAFVIFYFVRSLFSCREIRKLEVDNDLVYRAALEGADNATTNSFLFTVLIVVTLSLGSIPAWGVVGPLLFPDNSRSESISEAQSADTTPDSEQSTDSESLEASNDQSVPQSEEQVAAPDAATEQGADASTSLDSSSVIPAEERWDTAYQRIGTYGTITGPVVSVVQNDSSNTPIYINIGRDFPDPSRVQVIIWPEDKAHFLDMLYTINAEGWWLRITGNITLYEGIPEIDVSNGSVEYEYWFEG